LKAKLINEVFLFFEKEVNWDGDGPWCQGWKEFALVRRMHVINCN
jgi:hypothetical protein